MSASAAPDFNGFADAQARLRAQFGQDVVFKIPNTATYAGPTDPETGRPLDPYETPLTGGGETSVALRLSVVNDAVNSNDESQFSPVGQIRSNRLVFIVPGTLVAQIEDAVAVICYDERYEIEEIRPDAMGPVPRSLVYTRKI